MGQALYRKYRSKSLDEIVGQEHITDTLNQAIKQDRISHAYLLTGPRGVGKTSIARILAHEINGLPYTDDSTHIDIIEIDAASNRRIDEIRELRDKVNIAPTSAKYKVYIIDEVHMLTKEAFNALLKTLEEPPAHVIFILATTDAHKLPETIISRTQRFSFKPVEKNKVVEHLRLIASNEGINVSDEALNLLAKHGEGSFRDSISLLDQASNQSGTLEATDVLHLLGIPPQVLVDEVIQSLNKDPATLINRLESLYDQGYQPAAIAKQLASSLRHELILGALSQDSETVLSLMDGLIKVPASHDPARYLELILLEHADFSVSSTAVTPKPEKAAKTPVESTSYKLPAKSKKNLNSDIWPEVLSQLKLKHNTLYGVVRMAEPSFEGDSLTLLFGFSFHQKRSNESSNRQKIADIIREITDQNVNITCILDTAAKPPKPAVVAEKPLTSNDLSTISNIFGKAELLES